MSTAQQSGSAPAAAKPASAAGGGESSEADLISQIAQQARDGELESGTVEPESPKVESLADAAEVVDQAAEDAPADDAPSFDADALAEALASRGEDGQVDREKVVAALRLKPEDLGVRGSEFKALRAERKRATDAEKKATELASKLEEAYGDPIKVREEVDAGNLDALADHLEKVSGITWNELNRLMLAHAQGKTPEDLATKRRLREYEQKERARAESETKKAEEEKGKQRVAQAKSWIEQEIKGESLAKYPGIADLVFEKMRSERVREPVAALKLVRKGLVEQVKHLRSAGLLEQPKAPEKPMGSKPRRDAAAGAAGNSKPMTEDETIAAILREEGIKR